MWWRNLMNVSPPYVTALTFFNNSLLCIDVKSLPLRLCPTFYRSRYFPTTHRQKHTLAYCSGCLTWWKENTMCFQSDERRHTHTHNLLRQYQAYFPGDCFKSEIRSLYIAWPISSPAVCAEHCHPWWCEEQTLTSALQSCALHKT